MSIGFEGSGLYYIVAKIRISNIQQCNIEQNKREEISIRNLRAFLSDSKSYGKIHTLLLK